MLNKTAVLNRLTNYKSELCRFELMRPPRRSDDSVASENSEIRWQRVRPITRHPKIHQHLWKLFVRTDGHARIKTHAYIHVTRERAWRHHKPAIPNGWSWSTQLSNSMYDSWKPAVEARASITAKDMWDLPWEKVNETGPPRQFFGFVFRAIIPIMHYVHIHSTTISAI